MLIAVFAMMNNTGNYVQKFILNSDIGNDDTQLKYTLNTNFDNP